MTTPSVSQGYGGQLYLHRGGQLDLVNRSLEAHADPALTEYVGMLNVDTASVADFHRSAFGGENSWFPGSYANHKPAAFLARGRLIQALNRIQDSDSRLYIGGWDGSGLFFNRGGQFQSVPWKSGKGWDALSPSGTLQTVKSRDHALLNHNGIVFGFGAHGESDTAPATSQWPNKLGWTFDFSTVGLLNASEPRRTYRVFSISDRDDRIMGPVTRILPNALSKEHLNSCDAVSLGDDVYYANWIDVLRFPGASGAPQLMYSDVINPLAKSFGFWPSGGYQAGEPVGEIRLLVLEGDGKLWRLKAPASGRELLVDLTEIRADEAGRPKDNFFARINSTSDEPGRPPLLLTFDGELHAFAITESSGYMHFACAGNPSGTGGWSDRTDDLPPDLQSKDGCVYGFVDEFRQRINLLQVSYSKFGIYGAMGGGQNCGGGFWLRTLDANGDWLEVDRGNVGLPMRGLVPYQNLGPWALTPSGGNPEVFKCSDYTLLSYKLFDQEVRRVDVEVEFSVDRGITWSPARRFRDYTTGQALGSGVSDLATAPPPTGEAYTFYWDHVNDVGFNNALPALLRVRPKVRR